VVQGPGEGNELQLQVSVERDHSPLGRVVQGPAEGCELKPQVSVEGDPVPQVEWFKILEMYMILNPRLASQLSLFLYSFCYLRVLSD